MYTLAIIDDEAYQRRALLSCLDCESLSLQCVAQAGDGAEGLQLILEKRPDIAFVDINMPHMDGLAMIEKAQQAGSKTLFILLTGYDDFAYARKAIGLSVMDYLLKPVSRAALEDAVLHAQQRCLNAAQIDEKISALEQENAQLMLSDFFSGIINGAPIPDVTELHTFLDSLHLPLEIFDSYCLVSLEAAAQTLLKTPLCLIASQNGWILFKTARGKLHLLCSDIAPNAVREIFRAQGVTVGLSRTQNALSALPQAYAQSQNDLQSADHAQPVALVTDTIRTYVLQHLSDSELSISTIAKNTYLNYSYLCYCFKRDCDQTINDYITQCRIDAAKAMFLAGNTNISQVALKVGYNSNSYFSKSFKKMVGVSPSEFLGKS